VDVIAVVEPPLPPAPPVAANVEPDEVELGPDVVLPPDDLEPPEPALPLVGKAFVSSPPQPTADTTIQVSVSSRPRRVFRVMWFLRSP
jgi:hypothetical protein